jgi:hypothetical protein
VDLIPIIKGAATWVPWLYKAERGHTGGAIAARYCYAVWLRHLVLLESCGLTTHYPSVAELGPGDSLGISIAALLTGSDHVAALDVVRYARGSSNERVLTELRELLARREPVPDATEMPAVHPCLSDYKFPPFLGDARLKRALTPERLDAIRAAVTAESNDGMVRYYVPWQKCWNAEGQSVDLVFSQAVLEHVEDLDAVQSRLAAGVRIGGVASHVIDFRSHKLTSGWDGHLRYGSLAWNVVKGRRPYLLNRRAPSEHLTAIENAGFSVIRTLRTTAAPTVPRHKLHPQFRNWSDEDRSTATMVVVAKRVR